MARRQESVVDARQDGEQQVSEKLRYRLIAAMNHEEITWYNDEGTSTIDQIHNRVPGHLHYVILAMPPEYLATDLWAAKIDQGTWSVIRGPMRRFDSAEAAIMAVKMGVLDEAEN